MHVLAYFNAYKYNTELNNQINEPEIIKSIFIIPYQTYLLSNNYYM